MKTITATTLLLLTLVGCTTYANYKQNLNSWVGAEENELIIKWGKPARVFESDGYRYLVYATSTGDESTGFNKDSQNTVAGTSVYAGANGWVPTITFASQCQTIFEIKGTKVISYDFKGNDCR